MASYVFGLSSISKMVAFWKLYHDLRFPIWQNQEVIQETLKRQASVTSQA